MLAGSWRPMVGISMSYRRGNSAIAGRIADRLRLHFGTQSVFMDVRDIAAGHDFRQRIKEALASSQVLIAVIGPRWLNPPKREGHRTTIQDEQDWVRIEVETALQKKLRVIPVLVEGGVMPKVAQLPASIQELAFRQAIKVDSGPDFDAHMGRLIAAVASFIASSSLEASVAMDFAPPAKARASRLLRQRRAAVEALPIGLSPTWEERFAAHQASGRPNAVERDWASDENIVAYSRVSSLASKLLVGAAAIGMAAWLFHRELTVIGAALVELFRSVAPATPGISREDARTIDVSVFGPGALEPGREGLIQVFLHELDQRSVAQSLAQQMDPRAVRRGIKTLAMEILHGQTVEVLLESRGLVVEQSMQSLIWRGEPDFCQFTVAIPEGSSGRTFYPRVLVLVDSVPIGSLTVAIRAEADPEGKPITLLGDNARRYQRAFLSYASANRSEVLKRAQMLRAMRISFFQDILDLDPGVRWERKVYKEIDSCDVFLLFWSSAAKASEWVLKEAEYALRRQRASDDAIPDITPVLLEGPPPPPPPDFLKDIHFNDSLIYVLAGEAAKRDSVESGKPH
jgi:hypothetical protein